MAAGRKLMSVEEEQALVLRERKLYRIAAESWTLDTAIEVETHMKSHVFKMEIAFKVVEGKLWGGLFLTLARGVDPSIVEARGDMALRRVGAPAVSRLEEPKVWDWEVEEHPANFIGDWFFLEDKPYHQGEFFKEHLVDGQVFVEVDLEVAIRREKLDKARDRLEVFGRQIGELSGLEDYKLVCGEKEFPCHRAILAARSPVVARGLAQGEHLGRGVREQWRVHDSSPAAVAALMVFIYTAKVSLDLMEEEGMAVEVLKLADFFEVVELQAAAVEEIIRQLSASTALRALVEVDRHARDGGAARNVVIGFIKVHAVQVMASKDWGEFVNSGCHGTLFTELFAAVVQHRDSE